VTIILPLLAFAFVSLLVTAGAMALTPGYAAVIRRRLGEVSGKPVRSGSENVDKVVDTLKRIGNAVPKSPSEMSKLQLRLVHAGFRRQDAIVVFLGIRAGCALAVFAVMAAPFLFRATIPMALGGAGFGYLLPGIVLARMAKRRQHRIRLATPDALDLLVVSVEAGLGLSSSLQVAAERLRGPLGEEMRLALQEQSLGLQTTEALRNMLTRADTPALRAFVRSIVQGESLGVSTGEIMRNLARDMRKRRRAAAEERAQKAPVKVLFPLVFLIFPAMFVVLLGPAIFQFIEGLSGTR